VKSLFQFLQLGCWPIFHFSSCSPLHTSHCFSSWPNKVFVTENMETWCEKRKSPWERGYQERRETHTHAYTHSLTYTYWAGMTGFRMQQELEFKQAMVLTGGCCCTPAKKKSAPLFCGCSSVSPLFWSC
jgi:hypothetical protein